MKRASERYGAWFTIQEMAELSARVERGEAKFLLRESGTRAHFLIDGVYIVVYNKALDAITTFLPPDCIYNYLGPKKATSQSQDL